MKLLLALAILSLNANAQLISNPEARSIAQYLDNICPDTYCGGDVIYYVSQMECVEDSCLLDLHFESYEDYFSFDQLEKLDNFSNQTKNTTVTVKDITDIYSTCDSSTTKTPCLQITTHFTCQFNKVKRTEDLQDYFYTRLLDECLPSLEDIIYNQTQEKL